MPKRRRVQFASLEDVGRESQALLKSGYQRVGQWSLGTLTDHLGKALVYSCEGFPRHWSRPVQRILRRLFLKKLLSREQTRWRFPAPIGVDLHVSDPDGVASLLDGIERFQRQGSPRSQHPVLGELSREQWLQFHFWHCEHHLSFLLPATKQVSCTTPQMSDVSANGGELRSVIAYPVSFPRRSEG